MRLLTIQRLNAILLALFIVLIGIPRFTHTSANPTPQTTILFTRTISAKTTAYTIAAGDSGKVFTTRGASGAVTFTLPTVASTYTGFDFYIFNAVDQDLTVAATTNGEIMFKNDLAANSVAYSTSGEKIGGGFHITCDGTSWLVMPLAEETQTITVAT